MAGCGCKSGRCGCVLDGDAGISITGNGSTGLPYRPIWQNYILQGSTNGQTEVVVTGTGTLGDPWVITINTQGGSITQTIYTTGNNTWTKGGGDIVHVVAIGGGGGGGASANPTGAAGGSGGAGGAMSTGWFLASTLPETVDLKVGSGGGGGSPTEGLTSGQQGLASYFGDYLYAPGGMPGKSQAGPSQTQITTLGGTAPEGGPGGAGGIRDGNSSIIPTTHYQFYSPTGGGAGEGDVVASSVGGDIYPGNVWGGRGGVGQAAFSPAVSGGLYGGGGGGGGGHDGLVTSGGDGAPGIVVVTVW